MNLTKIQSTGDFNIFNKFRRFNIYNYTIHTDTELYTTIHTTYKI